MHCYRIKRGGGGGEAGKIQIARVDGESENGGGTRGRRVCPCLFVLARAM